MSKPPSFCDPTRNPIYGMLEDLLKELDRIKKELEALDLDNVADKIANDLRKELEDRLADIEAKITQAAQDIEENILDLLVPIQEQIEEAQQQLEILKRGLTVSEAWAWSEDGTERFTTVYPRKNLWDGTITTTGFIRSNDGRHIQRTLTGALTTMSVAGNRFMEANGTAQHRTHTGFLFLNGECLTADQVPTRFAGTTSTSNGFRLNYNDYDLETGYFETAYQMFRANNSNILQIVFPDGVLKEGDVIDIYDLKIEETFVNDFRAQGVYTTPEELDPVNAFPQYHAYALQTFSSPERYSRFEYTREAIRNMVSKEADDSHKEIKISDIEGLEEALGRKTNVRGYSNGFVTNILGSNVDMLRESGTFVGSNMDGTPPSVGEWYIQNLVQSDAFITQIAYSVRSPLEPPRYRIFSNGEWHAWQKFALE
nr:hypothetical protein [Enterococcus innesii]